MVHLYRVYESGACFIPQLGKIFRPARALLSLVNFMYICSKIMNAHKASVTNSTRCLINLNEEAMKTLFAGITLAVMTTLAFAQGQLPTLPGQGQAVASPNRAMLSTLAASGRNETGPGHTDGPVLLVDSIGKKLGRIVSLNAAHLLASYKDKPILISSLEGDSDVLGGLPKSNGLTWSKHSAIYYESGNCTGMPYVPSSPAGTPYLGLMVKEAEQYNLLVWQPQDAVEVTVQSAYNYATLTCVSFGGSQTGILARFTVIPATAFGSPPFYLK
jgi:hypothetical protein